MRVYQFRHHRIYAQKRIRTSTLVFKCTHKECVSAGVFHHLGFFILTQNKQIANLWCPKCWLSLFHIFLHGCIKIETISSKLNSTIWAFSVTYIHISNCFTFGSLISTCLQWCLRRDLNPHDLSITRFLVWAVYQFQHIGVFVANHSINHLGAVRGTRTLTSCDTSF